MRVLKKLGQKRSGKLEARHQEMSVNAGELNLIPIGRPSKL